MLTINGYNLSSAVNEISPIGALQSFTTTPQGVLTGPHDTISSEGDRPAFTAALSTGQVGVVNYNSGTGRIIPTDSTFLFFDNEAAPLITFPPPVDNLSHPHMVVEFEGEVIIPDLVSRFLRGL